MKKVLFSAVAALAIGATSMTTAFAATPYQQSQDHRNDGRNDRGDNRNDNNQFKRGAYEVNGHRYERVAGPQWKAPRGYQARSWQRGQRLPSDYRKVVVRDYRSYHLNAPPRGYEYVRVGNDVILTAVATSVISAIIANAFYN
jgi:Ni/Co efflux regulator RcnB